MPYVSGFDRNQLMRCSWDAFVDEESMPENQVFGQSVGGDAYEKSFVGYNVRIRAFVMTQSRGLL